MYDRTLDNEYPDTVLHGHHYSLEDSKSTASPSPQDIDASVDKHFQQADESREILRRREFVRAKKARQWITSKRMVPDLCKVIVGAEPNESFLHCMLKEHREGTWTGACGIRNLPLVRLAQPGRSPAAYTLDRYSQMQTTPLNVLLEVVTDWPDICLGDEEASLFGMLVDVSSSVWRREHIKHLIYPWKLACLWDPKFPEGLKREILNSFLNLGDCCLDDGFSKPLRDRLQSEMLAVENQLGGEGKLNKILFAAFTSKSQNVELENNFARSSSSKMYVRGKLHSSTTMSCKHTIAEIHHNHKLATGTLQTRKRDAAQAGLDAAIIYDCSKVSLEEAGQQASQAISLSTSVSTSARGIERWGLGAAKSMEKNAPKRLNSWHVCLAETFKQPQQFGESSKARCERLTAEAKEQMRDVNIKQQYAAKAKSINDSNKAVSSQFQNGSQSRGLLSMLEQPGGSRGGPWNLSDASYPLAVDLLQDLTTQKGFVKRQASRFASDYGKAIGEADDLEDNSVVLDKFCVKLGGCYNCLDAGSKDNISAILRQMKNVARLHRGRSATKPEPFYLLILAQPRSLTNDIFTARAYIVCQATLSPLDVCLWKCVISEVGGSGVCEQVACPKAFTATLDYNVGNDHCEGGSFTVPALQTMHQFAYNNRADGLSSWQLRLTTRYRVTSLQTVMILDADDCFIDPDAGLAPIGDGLDGDGDDGGNDHDDDPHEHMRAQCMSFLRGQMDEPKKSKPKAPARAQHPSDEPRSRKLTSGSSRKSSGNADAASSSGAAASSSGAPAASSSAAVGSANAEASSCVLACFLQQSV